jgi:hypothetical protein
MVAADYDWASGSSNGLNYIEGQVSVVCHPDAHGLNGDGCRCE